MKLSNLKVGRKLGLGFGIVLSLLSVIAMLSYLHLTTLGDAIHKMGTQDFVEEILVLNVHSRADAIYELSAANFSSSTIADVEAERGVWQHVEEIKNDMDAYINKLGKIPASAGSKKLRAEADAAASAFSASVGKAIGASKQDRFDEARLEFQSTTGGLYNIYATALNKLTGWPSAVCSLRTQ